MVKKDERSRFLDWIEPAVLVVAVHERRRVERDVGERLVGERPLVELCFVKNC